MDLFIKTDKSFSTFLSFPGRRASQELTAFKHRNEKAGKGGVLLLMVQKSGVHQLRLVDYPIIYRFFLHPRWSRISSINSRTMGSLFEIDMLSIVQSVGFGKTGNMIL